MVSDVFEFFFSVHKYLFLDKLIFNAAFFKFRNLVNPGRQEICILILTFPFCGLIFQVNKFTKTHRRKMKVSAV